MAFLTIFSNTFIIKEVSETGRYGLGKWLAQPDLSIGVMIACLQMSAIWFVSRDLRHSSYMGLLIVFLQALRNRTGQWSGPGAELFFKLSISFSMSCGVKVISNRHGSGELASEKNVVGISETGSSGFENTEAYCLARTLHISGASLISMLSIFRGPVEPLVTCFFFF